VFAIISLHVLCATSASGSMRFPKLVRRCFWGSTVLIKSLNSVNQRFFLFFLHLIHKQSLCAPWTHPLASVSNCRVLPFRRGGRVGRTMGLDQSCF